MPYFKNMLLLGIFVSAVTTHPTPDAGALQYYEDGFDNFEQHNDIQMPNVVMKTVTGKPRTLSTFADFLTGGLQAGYTIFDNWIPRAPKKQTRSIIKLQEGARNFNRSLHQEVKLVSLRQPEAPDAIKNITELIQAKIEIGNKNKAKQDPNVEPIKIEAAVTNKTDLDIMIKQLSTALDYIKKHSTEQLLLPPITPSTPTEDLIKHISSSVDRLPKLSSNESRSHTIKEITTALDILLNRMAKSASALIKDNSTVINMKQHKLITNITLGQLMKINANTSNLMARVVKHVTDAKREALREKLNSGGEVESSEVHNDFTNGDELYEKVRLVRQEDLDEKMNDLDADVNKEVEEVTPKAMDVTTQLAKQEESGSQSEEGGGNLVANLLSSFLGSLSKPDGGVDVDAIVGLVSGLSVQKDDGNYDFSGLTDLLQSFLGGDGMGGGGSDVGAFLGGLLGAIIQGSANPPGPQGTGKLTGNLVANILPGLSGPPAQTSSEEAAGKPQEGLNSGSFLAGILSSMLGASSGTSSGPKPTSPPMMDHGSAAGSAGFFNAIKNGIVKSVFSIITSLLTSSSGSSSKGH